MSSAAVVIGALRVKAVAVHLRMMKILERTCRCVDWWVPYKPYESKLKYLFPVTMNKIAAVPFVSYSGVHVMMHYVHFFI